LKRFAALHCHYRSAFFICCEIAGTPGKDMKLWDAGNEFSASMLPLSQANTMAVGLGAVPRLSPMASKSSRLFVR
jgi:hypothetical protein